MNSSYPKAGKITVSPGNNLSELVSNPRGSGALCHNMASKLARIGENVTQK